LRADAAGIDVPMTLGQKRKMFSLGSASDLSDDALWTTALPFMGDARTSSSDDDGVSRALAAAAAAVFLRVCRAGMVAAKLCPVSRQKTSSLSMCRKCARAGRGRRCNGGSVQGAGGRSFDDGLHERVARKPRKSCWADRIARGRCDASAKRAGERTRADENGDVTVAAVCEGADAK